MEADFPVHDLVALDEIQQGNSLNAVFFHWFSPRPVHRKVGVRFFQDGAKGVGFFIQAEAQQPEAVPLKFTLNLDQIGKFRPAGAAPGGHETDNGQRGGAVADEPVESLGVDRLDFHRPGESDGRGQYREG